MTNLTVSVNTYDDAVLLDNCLASIRGHCPHARIQVVDGRYAAWPDAAANSEDETPAICDAYGAEYHPDGPFPDEAAKHRHRRDLVETERVLFLDADERLLTFDMDGFDADTDYRLRIFNALMYGPRISYYPRFFSPGRMSVERVDKFMLDAPVERTDAVTIVHRADLRGDAYREAKLQRFEEEDRDPWYREYLESLAENDHEAEFYRCPTCGRESVTRSRLTGYGPPEADRNTVEVTGDARLDGTFSRVECCTATDGCYRAVKSESLDEVRYVPDRVEAGFEEDVSRVKLELMAAGWELALVVPTETFDQYKSNAIRWVEEEFDGGIRKPA